MGFSLVLDIPPFAGIISHFRFRYFPFLPSFGCSFCTGVFPFAHFPVPTTCVIAPMVSTGVSTHVVFCFRPTGRFTFIGRGARSGSRNCVSFIFTSNCAGRALYLLLMDMGCIESNTCVGFLASSNITRVRRCVLCFVGIICAFVMFNIVSEHPSKYLISFYTGILLGIIIVMGKGISATRCYRCRFLAIFILTRLRMAILIVG